jgi:glutathione S-transferase
VDFKLTSYVATLRYMVTLAKVGEPAVHEFLRGRIKGSLGILDGHLGKSAFAVGNEPSIADFSMCGYLYWPEEFGVSWTDYPRIGAWLERIKALPGWVHPYELMPGHPLKG